MKKTTITGLEEKWEVFLVYIISLLGFIFAFIKNDKVSDRMRFLYKQAGAMWIISLAVTIISSVLSAMGISFIYSISSVISLILTVFSIITIVKAFQNETYEIPLVSDMAKAIWK